MRFGVIKCKRVTKYQCLANVNLIKNYTKQEKRVKYALH